MRALKWALLCDSKRPYSCSSVAKRRTIRIAERASAAMAESPANCFWTSWPTTLRRLEATSRTKAASGRTRKDRRESFQFIYSRKAIIPAKLNPWTTMSMNTVVIMFCRMVTSFVILESISPTRLP